MHKHWFAIFKVNITAKVQNVRECLSEWYLLNRGTFCYQTCQVDTASLARASCRKCSLLSSRSSSQRELIWSNFDFIYYILWTADFLATKLSLTVHHHKPECLVKKWIATFKVKVAAKVLSVNERLSRWYSLTRQTSRYQTWYDDTSSWAAVWCKTIGLLSSWSRSHIIKIWQFLLCLLYCRFFGYQTWFVGNGTVP